MFCQYFCHWYSSERQRFSVPQQDTVVLTFSTDLLPCSANPAYHELLLTVLWYGVVHTSALVRCTAARMFEVCKQKFQIVMIFFGRGRGTIFLKGGSFSHCVTLTSILWHWIVSSCVLWDGAEIQFWNISDCFLALLVP